MRASSRWTDAVVATSTVLLLLFNAVSLQHWASSRKPDAATPLIAAAADMLVDVTVRAGLDRPRAAITAWSLSFLQDPPATRTDRPQR